MPRIKIKSKLALNYLSWELWGTSGLPVIAEDSGALLPVALKGPCGRLARGSYRCTRVISPLERFPLDPL